MHDKTQRNSKIGGVMTIEKEMKDIPLELRALRLKKQGLESEINKLNNEKFNLLKEILIIKEKVKGEALKFKETIQETSDEVNKKKSVIADCNKEKTLLKSIEIEVHHKKDEVMALIKKNQAMEIQIAIQDKELKESNLKLQQGNAQLEREKKIAKDIEVENRKKQKEFDDVLVNIDAQKLDIEDKKGRLDILLTDAQKVKQQYEDKLKEASENNKLLQTRTSELNSAIKSNEAEKEKTEALNKDLEEVIKETEEKGQSFDKMNAELENKQKEIEISELKLQKLARDKGLEKELKELQESLK